MKYFIVTGNPIKHSQSPIIHQLFAKQFDIPLHYEKQLLTPETFNTAITTFFKHGSGANITVPFKEMAYKLAKQHSKEAKLAQAVNTLSIKNEQLFGDNTDGIGLITDIIQNQKMSIKNKSVLLIGAGGASKGVIYPLIKQSPHAITITNRTFEKAQALANQFTELFSIKAIPIDSLTSHDSSQNFDLIINATSASLGGKQLMLSQSLFNANTFAYDMMYGATLSPFLLQAKQQNAHLSDGLGMLVEQAAQAFNIWHQKMPDTQPIIQSLKKQIAK